MALIGARIAQLRQAAGFTQKDMALRMGCGVRNYQRLETGLTNFGLRTLIRLALALNLSPMELLAMPRRAGPRHPADAAPQSFRYRASLGRRRRSSKPE